MTRIIKFLKQIDFLYYSALSIPVVFILWGSLGRGFLFTLDSQFTNNYNIFNLDFSYDLGIVKYLLYYLSRVIDPKILQILYFAICLYIPSFLGFKYLKKYVSKTAAFIASIFLIINPFVYERLVAGHIHLIFVIGLIIPYCHFLLDKKGKLRKYMLLLIPLVGSLISPHLIWYLSVPIMLYTLFSIKKKRIDLMPVVFLGLIAFGEFLILSSKSVDKTSDIISQFYTSSVLSLFVFEGMWAEKEKIVETIFTLNIVSIVIWVIFYGILLLGVKKVLSSTSINISIFLISSGLIGLFLSVLSLKEFDEIYSKFYIITGFAVMREGHKWLALYLVGFVGIFSVGIDFLIKQFKEKKVYIVVLLLLFILISSHKIFFLGNGKIGQSEYPANWGVLESIAKEDPDLKILVLPWSGYGEYQFLNNKYIADPSRLYFSNKVISARFPENMNYLNRCDVQDLDFCIDYKAEKKFWDEFIRENKIGYVLVNKVIDEEIEAARLIDKFDYEMILEDLSSTIYILDK
ncbi:hypothetical protein KBD45_06690 [Candidatus Dojkabacteria bacterium]|nr:hypothetical protein [Candidatus Dojkabacteria bacterium]